MRFAENEETPNVIYKRTLSNVVWSFTKDTLFEAGTELLVARSSFKPQLAIENTMNSTMPSFETELASFFENTSFSTTVDTVELHLYTASEHSNPTLLCTVWVPQLYDKSVIENAANHQASFKIRVLDTTKAPKIDVCLLPLLNFNTTDESPVVVYSQTVFNLLPASQSLSGVSDQSKP